MDEESTKYGVIFLNFDFMRYIQKNLHLYTLVYIYKIIMLSTKVIILLVYLQVYCHKCYNNFCKYYKFLRPTLHVANKNSTATIKGQNIHC